MKLNKKILSLFIIFGFFGIVYFLMPQTAHAQNLHADLTFPGSDATKWVFNVWKVMLGIANVIVVVILLFLAAINILHLQYDTYQIKKTLPLLIGGAIAANFSILICRMIVDAAQVLTATFAGDANKLVGDYLCAFAIGNGNPSFWGGSGAALGIIMVIIAGFIILIVVGVLAFLLWIRKTVIFLLVALSPVAFIFYAFPPTQGLFKQWWSYFLKFVFMGPLLMMIFWIASIIGSEGCKTGFHWNMALVVIGVSIIGMTIPFKLGGAVMSGWGKLGQWATGTGKGGFLRKPIDNAIQTKKDAWKERANLGLERHTAIGGWREQHAAKMKDLKDARQSNMETLEERRRQRAGGRIENEEIDRAMTKARLEQGKQDRTFEIYNTQRGRELAEFEADVANSQLRLEKRKEDSTVTIAVERLRANREIPEALRGALGNVDQARERLGMARNPAERLQAQTDIQNAEQALAAERQNMLNNNNPQINNGQAYTQAQVAEFEGNSLNRLQRTRYFAIINKRAYADAQDDASSNAPTAIADDIRNGGSMGPFQWTQQDAQNFFNNQRTSSSEATVGLASKMASLQINLKDSRTMGHAVQGYVGILNQANANFANEGIQRTIARMSDDVQDEVLHAVQRQNPGAGITNVNQITSAHLARTVLDTNGNYEHRGFATALANEYQMADTTGGFARIDPATGQPMRDAQNNIIVDVAGSSGLGRNVAGFVERL